MAIKLNRDPQPRWVPLPDGAALHMQPPTSYLVAVARARAEILFVELVQSGEAITRVGATIEGMPDMATPEAIKGLHDGLFALSLAEMATTDWKDVMDADGEPLAFNAGLLALLFSSPGVPDAFVSNYLHPLHEVDMEGNG